MGVDSHYESDRIAQPSVDRESRMGAALRLGKGSRLLSLISDGAVMPSVNLRSLKRIPLCNQSMKNTNEAAYVRELN